jgi:hypothetical protein
MVELRFLQHPHHPSVRRPVWAQVVLVSGSTEQPVSVRDVSLEGMQIATEIMLPTGHKVIVRLPVSGTACAEVRWSRNGRVGLRFDQHLSPWQLQSIVAHPS